MSAANWKHGEVAIETVITHIPLKPALLQAVFAIYSPVTSKDLSEGTSSSIFLGKRKGGIWPKNRITVAHKSQVCLAVKLLSDPDVTKHTQEVQVIRTFEFHPCSHSPRRPQHVNQ